MKTKTLKVITLIGVISGLLLFLNFSYGDLFKYVSILILATCLIILILIKTKILHLKE